MVNQYNIDVMAECNDDIYMQYMVGLLQPIYERGNATNPELTLSMVEFVLYDVYKDGCIVFAGVTDFQLLDIRYQITRRRLEGYSVRINDNSCHLFDDDMIETREVFISIDGEISGKYFPERLVEGHGYATPGNEALNVVLNIRREQKQ